ncbi:MAG: hypothetical protein ACRDQ7_02435, partial [Haloechinothrix sp.]
AQATGDHVAAVVPLRRADRARASVEAVDAERRRRREQAVTGPPQPPPRLGDGLRRRSLLILPDEGETPSGQDV